MREKRTSEVVELQGHARQGNAHVCHLDVAMYDTETMNMSESLKELLNLNRNESFDGGKIENCTHKYRSCAQ